MFQSIFSFFKVNMTNSHLKVYHELVKTLMLF